MHVLVMVPAATQRKAQHTYNITAWLRPPRSANQAFILALAELSPKQDGEIRK